MNTLTLIGSCLVSLPIATFLLWGICVLFYSMMHDSNEVDFIPLIMALVIMLMVLGVVLIFIGVHQLS